MGKDISEYDESLRLQETKDGFILHVHKKFKIEIKNGEIQNELSPTQKHFVEQYMNFNPSG